MRALLPSSPSTYTRQARRLRARWVDQPARLHRALRELQPAGEPAAAKPVEKSEQFAESVIQLLQREAGLLRYSARLDLLRGARRMGIERFEANLIIAAVQQSMKAGASTSAAEALPTAPWPRSLPRPRQATRLPAPLAAMAVVAIEGAVLLTVWWMSKS